MQKAVGSNPSSHTIECPHRSVEGHGSSKATTTVRVGLGVLKQALVVLKAEYASVVWMRCWFDSDRGLKMDMRREGMHGESSYGVRTPEKCVFSGSNPDISTDGPMVQRIERRFPMPEICVRFALGPQKCPRGVMESTKHYGCFGGGSNPPGGTKNMHMWVSG